MCLNSKYTPLSSPPSLPPRSAHTVSRSTLAYFHSAGFEEFRDSKGNPLPSLTVTTPTGWGVESPGADLLKHGPYQIAVQLMAFSV